MPAGRYSRNGAIIDELNNAGRYQKDRAEYAGKTGQQRALLCFLQVLSAEYALHDGLVGAPVEQVVEQHAEEQDRPRNHRRQGVRRIDRVELFCRNIGDEVLNTSKEAAVAEDADGQDRNQQTADQQAHAVYGIRYRNCSAIAFRPPKIA